MSISPSEYQRRYAAIQDLMKRNRLDSLLIVGLADDFNRGNIRYITGSGRGGCCIVPAEGRPILFVSPNQLVSPKLPRIIGAFGLLDLVETATIPEKAKEYLARLDQGNRVGLIGATCISVPLYSAIKDKFADRFLDVSGFLEPLRTIKSEEEIAQLRQAAAVADKVYRRLREIVRPGLDEYHLYGEVKKIIYEEGCEYSFDLVDGAGSMMNMSFFPTADRLEDGGTLFMEISPAYAGYYAQLPVTLPVGQYQPHVKRMAEAWHEADEAVRRLLRPGTKVCDLYRVMIETIQKHGFVSPLRPGHSVGLDILDFWSITESNEIVLKPNMVIAVHPCAMVKLGGDGVGMGYTYLITDSGAERLSKVDLARELLANQ